LIPLEELLGSGPPRDGIPSIDSPKFILAAEADWLFPGSRIIGLDIEGDIRVYPLAIFKLVRDCQRHCQASSCFNHILPTLWNRYGFSPGF
jgi:hypothetical protein